MSESRLHLHFLSLLLICCVSPSYFFTFKRDDSSYVACGPHQNKALTEFMNEFDSSRCNLSDPFNGVWCDNSTGAVTKLQLSDCLSGTLNPNSSLFRLHHLSHLDLNQNNFISSTLPFEFGNLKRLEFLSLYDNSFSGQVPSSFSNLNLLSYLDLSENELTGSFPLVRNLTKLSFLDLSNNHFSGTLNPDSTSLFEVHHLRNLHLGSNNFSSSLPSEFGNLNRLEYLSLSSNEFSGQVPPTISNLTSLKELYLERNQLNGSFPLVQNLTMLSTIDASDNHFSGTIPSYLLTMPSLTYLDLRGNDLTGSIEVDNSSTSSMLKSLYLGNNHFEGKIIEPISNLIKLKELHLSFFSTDYMIDVNLLFSSLKYLVNLDLSGNSISSDSLDTNSEIPTNLKGMSLQGCGITEFPNILKNLEKLEFIALGDNRIKGKVPEWLWNLPRLTSVFLSNNSITGFEGPVDVLVNSSLKYLQLELNCFEGAIPILPLYINFFAASHNRFSGSIPLSICNCRSLTQLMLDYNNLAGPIPKCLSHNNLTFVNLRKNNLEGSIPDAFCTGASLRSLDVGHNRLTGKLPRSLQNCSSLEFLVADHNKIKDKFPFWLKALPNLQVLILSSNKFYGSISPPGQGPRGFPELLIFEISDNKFTGSLPSRYFVNWKASSMNEAGSLYMHYGKLRSGEVSVMGAETIDLQYKGLLMEQVLVLTSYAAIDFSGNRIEGQIPESIGLLKALIALNLSNNAFTGHIPLSFSNLSNLESLDLSRNQLSGTIPSGLESLSFLSYINVSHNQLKGEIPQGTQITSQPKSSFEGNAGLCGLPLQDTCFGTNVPPTQQPKEENEEEEVEVLNWKGVVIGYGVGLFLGLTIAHVIASYKPEWLVKIIGPTKRRSR